MPLFMDRHERAVSVSAEEAAAIHEKDIVLGPKYGVRWICYYLDSVSVGRGDVATTRHFGFCVAEAPSKEAVQACHSEAHGRIPNEVIEVDLQTVERFLGRMQESGSGESWEAGAFRTILISEIDSPYVLTRRFGDNRVLTVAREHERIVRDAIAGKGGRAVRRTDYGVMGCFVSAAMAVECAISIQQSIQHLSSAHKPVPVRVRIGLSAGEPVADHGELFGAAVLLAQAVCGVADPGTILVAGIVRDVCIGKPFEFRERGAQALPGLEDEPNRLFSVDWQSLPETRLPSQTSGLSDREIEVLRLITAGRSNQQIADELVISLNTVARHVANILNKTAAANRAEATSFAHRHGLV